MLHAGMYLYREPTLPIVICKALNSFTCSAASAQPKCMRHVSPFVVQKIIIICTTNEQKKEQKLPIPHSHAKAGCNAVCHIKIGQMSLTEIPSPNSYPSMIHSPQPTH